MPDNGSTQAKAATANGLAAAQSKDRSQSVQTENTSCEIPWIETGFKRLTSIGAGAAATNGVASNDSAGA